MEDIRYIGYGEKQRISINFAQDVGLDILDLDVDIDQPMVIWEDNRAAIDYTKNPSNSKRTRHLDRDLKWIRREVKKG